MERVGRGLGERAGFWGERPVLVTGAQGFIGSWLVERLLELGADVVALVRDMPAVSRFELDGLDGKCTLVWSDLSDVNELVRAINEHGVNCCFHLAAQTIVGMAQRSPLSTFESNVRGTYNLLEAIRLTGMAESVVVASSDKAYGSSDELPYREGLPLNPKFPYDTSKACADLIARSYAVTYGMPVAVTRLANVYGGGDFNYSRIVPDTVRALIKGIPPIVRSDGTPERDFLYIEDAVDAYTAAAEFAGRNGAASDSFNFGTGEPVKVLSLVEKLVEISGREVEPDVRGSGTPSGEISRQFLDSTKAREELGWKPQWELREGLEATFSWYERAQSRLQ